MSKVDLSYIFSSDNAYVDEMYEQYKNNPESVEDSWQDFFKGFDLAKGSNQSEGFEVAGSEDIAKEFKVARLIQSYRARGHLLSDTNPVRERKDRRPHLQISDYGLEDADLNQSFVIPQIMGFKQSKLKDLIEFLQETYCSSLGVEYMHCYNTEVRRWFRDSFESTWSSRSFSLDKKKRILEKLNEAVVFEQFLNTKYVAQKRFSLEGGENTIPALDAIIEKGSELGVEEFVLGMAHRGRLNVLANTLGKTYDYIFNEFEGTATPDLTMGDGDVKYHLGFSSKVKTVAGKEPYLKLMPNPSHLEAVNPIVQGYVRAQSDILYKEDVSKVCPILIHGDAAVAGQGIVYETLQMSQLDGYHIGGTIHLVINNQIGFTTDFDDARSSDYCTSIARTLNIPVIHVNGDDAEAVVYAVELATEFRQKFARDIFVDIVCYRKHGHNEADEPKYTQPTLYKKISKHPDPRKVYIEKLIQGKEIEATLAKKMQDEFKKMLQDRFSEVKQKPLPYYYQGPEQEWENLDKATHKDFEKSPNTSVSKSKIESVLKSLTTVPESFKPIKKAQKLLADRKRRFEEDSIDWALGELFAYGTLLQEGVGVRMSGQDCIRGTFSHRQVGLFDEETNESHNSLNHIEEGQSRFRIYNSLLSEYAVLGFEYGYSLGRPTDINIWEAQFGDFANGAQTIIDQFISSAESKWQRMSGLFLYLPHGYEGQGPEHSNARPERFLQLSAELNMVIANCTTPANLFHLIRRQTAWNFRKPVVLFSPKLLLRHKLCVSKIEDLTKGHFQEFIDDKSGSKKKKALFCTGKIYYDLLERKELDNRDDVAIIRVEQLYPMAEGQLNKLLEKYKDCEKIWVQEEPKNMGAWTFVDPFIEESLIAIKAKHTRLRYVGRPAAASTATGISTKHKAEQQAIFDDAFAK